MESSYIHDALRRLSHPKQRERKQVTKNVVVESAFVYCNKYTKLLRRDARLISDVRSGYRTTLGRGAD